MAALPVRLPGASRSMPLLRLLLHALVPCLLAALLAGCGAVPAEHAPADAGALLDEGRAYAGELRAKALSALADHEVVSLGYLERARLGLGSPFRLAEYAMRDPRLPPEARQRLAYAILDLARRGDVYQVNPRVFANVRFAGAPAQRWQGEHHLALIGSIVDGAVDAAAGDAAARLSFDLAQQERTLTGDLALVPAAAALAADRRLAREDAARLLAAAEQNGTDPLELLRDWRRELKLAVERPRPHLVAPTRWVAGRGTRAAASLRATGQQLRDPLLGRPYDRRVVSRRGWLSAETGARLMQLAVASGYPPQPPVVAAMSRFREGVQRSPAAPAPGPAAGRMAGEVRSEEMLAAFAATGGEAAPGATARAVLQAAIYLRGWNQEQPWFPGDPGPAAKDLSARFGLAAIEFGDSIPAAWRSYQLRNLADGLAELQRVLPATAFRGLTIRIAPLPATSRALAVHDPRRRTLTLPPNTGAGTLAHEIAHDLDWQLAHRRYGRRGSYATDRAVTQSRGDRVAASMEALAAALAAESEPSRSATHDGRPAEVFARSLDWMVANALAREGRYGGMATSYQEAALPGYGSTRAPDAAAVTAGSLLMLLDEVSPLTPQLRRWVADSLPQQAATVLPPRPPAGVSGAGVYPLERLAALAAARRAAAADNWISTCSTSDWAAVAGRAPASQLLIDAWYAAAARGAAIEALSEWARQLPQRPPLLLSEAWAAASLDAAPSPALEGSGNLLDAVRYVRDLMEQVTAGEWLSPDAFTLRSASGACSGNPFADSL